MLSKGKQIISKIQISSGWALFVLTLVNILIFVKVFDYAKIKVKFRNEIFIEQELGNIQFYQTINIKNTGGISGYVINIEGYIRSKDRDVAQFKKKLTAEWVTDDKQFSPFTEIILAPNESYKAEYKMCKVPDRITRDSTGIINSLIMDEFDSARKSNMNLNIATFDVSKKLSKIIDDFNAPRIHDLMQGEYEYLIQVYTKNETFSKCYSFIITENNIAQFRNISKDFKKYAGFFNNGKRLNVVVPLTEIENPNIIKSLKKELEDRRN